MNAITKILGIISATTFLVSPISSSTGADIKINFSPNKGSAEFDMSRILEDGFAPLDISDADIMTTSDTDFPSSYSLCDYGLIQNVKVQGGYGTCWAQTAADSAETSLIKKNPTIDLSEWHLAYYAYTGGEEIDIGDDLQSEAVFNHGGSTLVAANMWAQWKGPVTEKEGLEYGSMNIITDTNLQEQYINAADYHLKNAYLFDFDGDNPELRTETIKNFLLDGQAVDISYYNSTDYYNYTYNSYMSGQDKTATHSVTIVGYDDEFPAENFTSKAKPENNGAWLAKNSWGNTWQDNGFFWISYEEPSLCEFSVFELEDSNNYTKNYHHDTFISNQSMKAGSGNTSYMANVFQSEGSEWLQAISFNFAVPDTSYQIDVYKNLKSPSSPKSGTKAYTMTGTNTLTGYQTIEFDQNITLSEGEYFSIVIKMTNSDNPYVIPIESCISVIDNETGDVLDLSNHTKYEQIKNYTGQNESFYSANGMSWTDVTDSYYHYTTAQKETLYNTLISTYGEDFVSSFDKNFGDDDVVIAQGNIPIKAFTNPINYVNFSHDSGMIYSDETVELSCGDSQDVYYSINGSDYVLYTDPISITENCTISATSDFETYSEKSYTPAYSTLNRLGYTFDKGTNAQYITPDENGNYSIDVDENQESIILLPISQGKVTIDGKTAASYSLTDAISLDYGENNISISIDTENALPNTINLTVNRTQPEILIGDVNSDGYVDASDSSEVLYEYVLLSSGESGLFNSLQKRCADFNGDGNIDASDASEILTYYAKLSAGETAY